MKVVFELGSIKLKFNISPEGARFIKTFAIKDSLKEFGFIQIEEILFWIIAETLKISSLSFESLILVISFFISNSFNLNFEIIEVSSVFVISLIAEVFLVSFLMKVLGAEESNNISSC